MEVLCYYFALLHLLLFVPSNPQPANGQGVSLDLDGSTVPNFGLLGHSDIDTSDDVDVNTSLVCRTDNTSCCRGGDNPNGGGFGEWFYPNGDVVVFAYVMPLPSGVIYRQHRLMQNIRLYRDNSASINATVDGIYRCEVADQNGVLQTRYVGLYTEGAGAGVVSISEAPQFSLISEDPLEFTLTSTTTGGPPTTAEWTLPSGTNYSAGDGFTQTLVSGTADIVRHTLTLTERLMGEFIFSTTNNRSLSVSMPITVNAADPPTGLMAVQDSLTSIRVSWTASTSEDTSRTGYRISYQIGDGSVQSANASAGATNHTLTGLQSGATYSISIVALSTTLPSTVVGPEMVMVEAFEAPTVMTSVPSPTSIRVTFTQPSGSLAAESYDIQYTRVTGAGQTLCASVQDTGTTTDVQSPFTITNLEEFSSYDITVTARVFSAVRATTKQATTSPAAPTAAPQGLTNTTFLNTFITVQWDTCTVECIDQNGVIVSYVVRYGVSASPSQRQTISVPVADPQTYTASGLTPFTRYSFEVAAVNSAGTGLFTTPLIVMTDGNPPNAPVNLASPSQSPTSITLSWEQPAGDFIDNYIIVYTYQGGCSDYTQPENMATVNDGTAREYTLENLQEFSGYAITVTAVNTGGGSTSDMITAATLADAPSGPPQSVMTSSVTSSSITVQWGRVSCIDRNSEITGYTVRYGQTGSTIIVMESVSGTSDRIFTASGLIPRTSYTFEVAAVSSEGTGPFSTGTTVETAAPDVLVPAPPVVTLGVVTDTTVTLSWSPQPGVGQYEVRYVRAVGSQQHGACRDFIDTGSVTTTDNSLTVAGLQEFSTYTVTVFAVNNAGRVPSEEIAILTPEAAPAPPRGVEVVNFTDTAITVNWEPLECIDINSQFEITGYAVRYGFSHEPGTLNEFSSSLPVRTINVLAPGFEYFFAVAAVNSNGEIGGFSNRIIQTTSGGQSPGSAGGTETAIVAAASVVVVLVVLILALSGVVIAVLVLKHRRGAPPLTQQPPTEAMVLTTFPESTKPPAAISTGPNAAYQTVVSGGRGQSQGNDGDHTYEYIVPPGLQSRDQPEPPHVYEST